MARVRDRVAVVTGSALGLGSANSRLLAFEGAKVVVADRDTVKGKAAFDRTRPKTTSESMVIEFDVISEAH